MKKNSHFEINFHNMDDSLLQSIGEDLSCGDDNSNFTSSTPNEMDSRIWTSYNVTNPPYRYGRVQNKGNGIEFEPASNFDCKNLDLPFDGYYSADGDDVDSPDGDEESVEPESEEEEVGGVDSADLPKYRQLVRQKKNELKDAYGKGHLKTEAFTTNECKTIKVPEGYTERECKNVRFPCPTLREPLKSCYKEVCVNVPKVRMIDKEVCVNVPHVRMKWISGWRKQWKEFKKNGGLQQLRMQSKGIAPIDIVVPEKTTPTPIVNTIRNIRPLKTPANQILLKGLGRGLKDVELQKTKVIKDSKSDESNEEEEVEDKKTSKNKSSKKESDTEPKKFLGMPKAVGITVVSVVGAGLLGLGAYFIFRKK